MDTHSVLVAARNLIDREGWTTGRSQAPYGGGYCMLGAVAKARMGMVAPEFVHSPSDQLLQDAHRVLRNIVGRTPWVWNDGLYSAPDAKEQVLAAFDRAIAATAPLPDLSSLREPEEVAV